ncbi:MarR family winged helix-turn-helix transcriptional regulator [Microbacterium sp. 1P10AE]|uniref:MarR family winged helix-turn-helix transcriptional regulator n=1 Tax=Microbacterium sp. 1P10AE TaxID=3132286 RepID=UPI0039A1CF38
MTRTAHRALPTKEELRIWRDYVETADALRSLLGGRMQSESGLSSGDYSVMLALSEARGRHLRSSELAEHMGWERSRLSHHLGRMEKRGLIRRDAFADDSRGAVVSLTDAGASAFRAGSVPHLRAVREVFIDAFDTDDLARIDVLTARLREHLGLESRG